MTHHSLILEELQEAQKVLNDFLSDQKTLEIIENAGILMAKSLNEGGKILSCGNGGSCCDAMHFAEELTGRYKNDRRPLAAMALADASHITCTANDYGFDHIFERPVQAFGKKGDVLLAISTSGNSTNVLKAAEAAKEIGMNVVALTGKSGGKLASLADLEIRAPHDGYADRIQEIHIKVIHIFIGIIEKELF